MEKAGQPFSASESTGKGNKVFFVIDSREEAYALTKLNGVRFSGEKVF